MGKKEINAFFSQVQHHIQVDQMAFTEGIESDEQKKLYSPFFNNQPLEFVKNFRKETSGLLFNEVIQDFIKGLVHSGKLPQRLAFKSGQDKLFVWAQVANGDESTEGALILVTADVNAHYYETGFSVSLMFVEERHEISIPAGYIELDLHPTSDAQLQTAHKAGRKKP